LSRTALFLIPALLAAPAAAQPGTAQRALDSQRSEVRSVVSSECDEAVGDEIVVCGRRAEEEARRYRVDPSPDPPRSGDRAGGEQLDAMGLGTSPCTTVGPVQRCTRGLDVIGIGATIFRGIRAIRARRD
jgi:hypothetical protein